MLRFPRRTEFCEDPGLCHQMPVPTEAHLSGRKLVDLGQICRDWHRHNPKIGQICRIP